MTSPTLRRRRLSSELRRQRVQAGLSRTAVAEELEWPPARLGHIESGSRKWPSAAEIATLLRLYGVTGGHREAILTLLSETRARPWWIEYEDVLSSAYVGNEAGAVAVRAYAGLLVPALLQVPEYTTHLARSLGHGEDTVERMVAACLKRQEVLHGGGLGRYHAFLEEDALHRVSGDPGLLRVQARGIVELAERAEAVTVQLIPTSAGPHAGYAGPFAVLEFDEGEPDLAYVESPQGGAVVESAKGVDACRRVWDALTRTAVPPENTLDILRRMALLT